MVEIKNEQIERADYRAGLICHMIRCVVGAKDSHPMDGFKAREPVAEQPQIMTEADMLANWKAIAGAKK